VRLAEQTPGDDAMSDGDTLFEIDRELDSLLDEIEEQAEENGSGSSVMRKAKR
jgi:hypothetical protein